MNLKSRIRKNQWTYFWNDLHVYIKKPDRFLKSYDIRKDFRKLLKIGVSEEAINIVREAFNYYQEPLLQFHRFVSFFTRDPATSQEWIKESDTSKAFESLFRKLHYANLKQAKSSFLQLFLLHKFNERGEGKHFECKYIGHGSLDRIKSSLFSQILSLKHENASYKAFPSIKIGNSILLPIVKNSEGRDVYKFIRLKRYNDKISIDISVDSSKELNIIKFKLTEYFRSYIDVPEVVGDFSKILTFLQSGESEHYLLIGSNYYDNEYKISVFPQFNQTKNIAHYAPYKTKYNNAHSSVLDSIVNIRVSHKIIKTHPQTFINLYAFFTGGIIGALTLALDDRKLNSRERASIRADFLSDFNLPLSTLIRFDTVSDEDIYKVFLKNTVKKQRKVELRSELSMRIYNRLVAYGLASLTFESTEQSCFCFNKDCRLRYKKQWDVKYCFNCGAIMFKDKKIVIQSLDEKKIADFILNVAKEKGFKAQPFKRRLLNRNIFTVEVRKGQESICFIPVTKILNQYQLEILQYRYPNAVLITSKDDADILQSQSEVDVLELYKLVPNILDKEHYLSELLHVISVDRLKRIRNLSLISGKRINNQDFYRHRNSIVKNFGAEFFEADTSVLLSYIFGNSIWLGASKRGSAFPDGITAFPLTESMYGCFVWDTKYCEGTHIVFGSEPKNEKYIRDGKKNKTVANNGGLKGFLFVSTVDAPKNFNQRFGKLAKRSGRIKITFMKAEQVSLIYKHYRIYESDIQNNSQIQNIFFTSMKKLLYSTSRKKFSEVITTQQLNKLFQENATKYINLQQNQISQ